MYRTISFLGAVILVISSALLRSDRTFANEAKFEVWYTNTDTGEPVREDYFSTMGQAVAEANKVIKHRDTNTVKGIGDVWITGSDGSRIWKNGQSLTPPDRVVPNKPELTPVRKLPGVDPGPMNPPNAKSRLAGKTGRGTMGGKQVTMQFLANGDIIFGGEFTGKGKWSSDSDSTVRMQTSVSSFKGNIAGDKVSGLRFLIDNKENQPPLNWNITLDDLTSISGTQWVPTAGKTQPNGTAILDFQPGGKLKNTLDNGDVVPGRWTQSGNVIKVKIYVNDQEDESFATTDEGTISDSGKLDWKHWIEGPFRKK